MKLDADAADYNGELSVLSEEMGWCFIIVPHIKQVKGSATQWLQMNSTEVVDSKIQFVSTSECVFIFK